MAKDITQLDDYTKLKKLASALWQQDNSYHGAAIMIGAGFSRSAATTGDRNKKLPLWFNFSELLTKELNSSSSDPLRLAEEYNAYFGKQALHDLIKKEINDSAWMPGELHKSLLELPWSEVLTTNWDTLLERASEDIHQPVYSIVSKPEDLSSARSPRIVKLHGTIDVTKDLIFTQEDYRKYPQQYAAFVNFARQVFIENELCLMGFSGDDPNFLQWAGWVRDHLTSHSRQIYLVGALGLNSAKRKYLESLNIAPIDLYSLVKDYDDAEMRHFKATGIFLQALLELKPKNMWEWEPTQLHRTTMTEDEINRRYQDHSHAANLLERQLKPLENDRLSYPEWLICPNILRFNLHMQLTDPWPSSDNLSEMNADSRVSLLYEIAWHYKVTFEIIPSWLIRELLVICDLDKPCLLTKKQQLEIALLLLKNTRWLDKKEREPIIQTTKSILESGTKYWSDINNELSYHFAILARDTFDYLALEKHTAEIVPNDPIWKLRKASLFAELGNFDEGKKLISEAYSNLLKQYRNNYGSIYLLSRLAWAHWLVRGINLGELEDKIKVFPFDYKETKCDPWEYIEYLNNKVTQKLAKQQEQEIEPLFEPGHYKDNSNSVTWSNELHPMLLLEGISNTVGLPLRWQHTNFLVDSAAKISELVEIDSIQRFSLAIRAANSETSNVVKKIFSRVSIACLSQDEAHFLITKSISSIEYWCEKLNSQSSPIFHYSIERLRIFIEVLARVSVRATVVQAKEIFRLAISLGKNPKLRHLWLFDSIKDLIEFSLKSIPNTEQHEVLHDALSYPLETEIQKNEYGKWANPVIDNPGERKQNIFIDKRINEIIDSIEKNSSKNAPALLRLLPLIKYNFLTEQECRKISLKIWGDNPDYKDVPKTGLLNYVLLELPNMNSSSVKTLIREYLFEQKKENLFKLNFLMDVVNAALGKNIRELPSKEQAIDYFEKLTSWRLPEKDNDIIGFSKNIDSKMAELISEVLARSIVPALPKEALTQENFQRLCDTYMAINKPEILMAYPYFAASDKVFIERVESLIKKGFQSIEPNKLAYTSYALLTWRELQDSSVINKLIKRLIYMIGSNQKQGLAALLWTANQMYKKDYLSNEDIESLSEILPVIFDSTSYERIPPYNQESVSISLVRAACVRLARDILNKEQNDDVDLKRILEVAKNDPLPEVRFAEITDI